MSARLTALVPELPGARVALATDLIVRVVLSHVMRPSGPPRRTADGIAEAARLLLR